MPSNNFTLTANQPPSQLRQLSGQGFYTEQDILKILIEQPGTSGREIQRNDANENSLRICLRIWSAYRKFIKVQCNKGRVIDSIYFGSFFKKDVNELGESINQNNNQNQGQTAPTNSYGCLIVDQKKFSQFSEFKQLVNSDNYEKLPPNEKNKENVGLNLQGISSVCNCSQEQVSQMLSKVRDLAFQIVLAQRKQVCLNLSIGTIIINPNQTFEFKTATNIEGQNQTNSTFAPSSVGEIKSQYLDPERSRVGSKEQNLAWYGTQQPSTKQKIQSLLKPEYQQNQYEHLSDFLKNQIIRSQNKISSKSIDINKGKSNKTYDTISEISKKNRYSHALIEKASQAIKEQKERSSKGSFRVQTGRVGRVSQEQAIDDSENQELFQTELKSTISQPKEFLKSRLAWTQQRGSRAEDLNKQKTEQTLPTEGDNMSYVSQKSVNRTVLNKTVDSNNRRLSVDQNKKQGQPSQDDGVMAGNVHSLPSKYRIDLGQSPFTSQTARRDKINDRQNLRTASAANTVPNLSRSQKLMSSFYAAERPSVFQGTESKAQVSEEEVRSIIGLALNRKQISAQYHSEAYPYFMRSQGPFKIFDHAQQKGNSMVQNLIETNGQAHQRFQAECQKIKEMREYEREQFKWQKDKQDIIEATKATMLKKNKIANNTFILQQIEQEKQKREINSKIERLYYKPHLGPEETDEKLDKEDERIIKSKQLIKSELVKQLALKNSMKLQSFQNERQGDLQNLTFAQEMFLMEEKARAEKMAQEKIANKLNWEQQMKDRKLKETVDKLFY